MPRSVGPDRRWLAFRPEGDAIGRTVTPRFLAPVAALAGFGAVFALVRAKRSEAFDLAVTLKLQGAERPWLRRTMALVSWPGFPPQSRIIPPVLIGTLAFSGRRVDAAYQAAAWGGAAISTVLKEIMRRPRPLPPAVQVVVAPLGGTSFPSGHVLTYVMFYGFLAHLLAVHGRADPADRAATIALLGLIAMIGPSRVEEGHHWTTDVAASYLVGTAALLGLIQLHDWRPGP
jgi:membrane-associated phospholipid phosphatase